MKDEKDIIYELAKIYGFVTDILEICKNHNNNYKEILTKIEPYNAICMLFVQMGERAVRIRNIDKSYLDSAPIDLKGIISIKNIIVHSYTTVNVKILEDTLKEDIPLIKEILEKNIEKEILRNPKIILKNKEENNLKALQEIYKVRNEKMNKNAKERAENMKNEDYEQK